MKKTFVYLSTFISIVLLHAAPSEFARDKNHETVVSKNTNLMWQDNNAVFLGKYTWQEANDYCDNLTLASFSDWRLPKNTELFSIYDSSLPPPCIKNGIKNIAQNGSYWSATSYAGYPGKVAWQVGGGGMATDDKTMQNYVRCVRNIK